jgi:hypothetical protein
MNYIGIDNGVSGSLAILDEKGTVLQYGPTPIFKELNYTKTKAWINRIDTKLLTAFLQEYSYDSCKALVERPMVCPGRFRATVSALRALEATQIVLEDLKIPYQWIDSREWQKVLLPAGLEKEELKTASTQICKRIFPSVEIKHDGDGDGLLIAEYLRRKEALGKPEVLGARA